MEDEAEESAVVARRKKDDDESNAAFEADQVKLDEAAEKAELSDPDAPAPAPAPMRVVKQTRQGVAGAEETDHRANQVDPGRAARAVRPPRGRGSRRFV